MRTEVVLVPGRWGWWSNVRTYPTGEAWLCMTLQVGWWRPTRRGAERVAQRWARRDAARAARELQTEIKTVGK